jgi:hypothetical protein
MRNPTSILVVALLLCSFVSCVLSMVGGGGGKGGFEGGFWRGLTNPVGAASDLIDLMQGKKPGNTMQQAGSETECNIKCGGSAGCEKARADHAAGAIPAERADYWAWCSGVPNANVPETSKEKFGQACCPI